MQINWQKAVLLKVDTFGCFQGDLQASKSKTQIHWCSEQIQFPVQGWHLTQKRLLYKPQKPKY